MNISELLNDLEAENLSQYVDVVSEPEYSRSKLVAFENKYKISSKHLIENSHNVNNSIQPKDLLEWHYNINIYLKCGGNLDNVN